MLRRESGGIRETTLSSILWRCSRTPSDHLAYAKEQENCSAWIAPRHHRVRQRESECSTAIRIGRHLHFCQVLKNMACCGGDCLMSNHSFGRCSAHEGVTVKVLGRLEADDGTLPQRPATDSGHLWQARYHSVAPLCAVSRCIAGELSLRRAQPRARGYDDGGSGLARPARQPGASSGARLARSGPVEPELSRSEWLQCSRMEAATRPPRRTSGGDLSGHPLGQSLVER